MKTSFAYIIILFIAFACNNTPQANASRKFYNTKQDQFTFLVFDAVAVDSFFKKYQPLSEYNKKLVKAFADSLQSQDFSQLKETTLNHSSTGQKPADTMRFDIAPKILELFIKKGDSSRFNTCLSYLFFYECLPADFHNKWIYTEGGNFKFNSTFFELLRNDSKELDDLIYGDLGYWDNDLKSIFEGYVFNEITPAIAAKIKNAILSNDVFKDDRFKNDKLRFLSFLDKTISGQWRFILIDWN